MLYPQQNDVRNRLDLSGFWAFKLDPDGSHVWSHNYGDADQQATQAVAADDQGNIILADGNLYCYSERGDIALVRPDPKAFDIVSSFRIGRGSGPHWAHPVIKDGRLYVRHGDVLMVFDIAAG